MSNKLESQLNRENIGSFIKGSKNEDRTFITVGEATTQSADNMGQILDVLDYELQIIELEAKIQCDRWWEAFNDNIKSEKPDSSYLATRIRRTNDSIVMEWHIRKVFKGKGAKRYISTYLKKGSEDRYSDLIFKKESGWAQELGKDIENNYTALRKRAKRIGLMKRSITAYIRLLAKNEA